MRKSKEREMCFLFKEVKMVIDGVLVKMVIDGVLGVSGGTSNEGDRED